MAMKLGIDVRITRLLLEVGVLASYEGLEAEGEAIVRSVAVYRDDVPQPGACLVAAFYFQKRYGEAIDEGKALLRKFPNSQIVKALMGVAMFESGLRDWDAPLKEVVEDGRDEWAINLARSTLGYEHKFQGAGQPVRIPAGSPSHFIYA
jgi:hypothetical protein